jgi:CO dehydrogenase/acetyl-CoA synthase alpha subunit
MDKEIPDYREGIDVRIIGKNNGQPEIIVITGKNSSSFDKWDVQDMTTGNAVAMKAANGKVIVFTQQSDGSFNKYPMEIYRETTIPKSRHNGEVSKVSVQEVRDEISKMKDQSLGASAPESGDKIRQEYLNKPK